MIVLANYGKFWSHVAVPRMVVGYPNGYERSAIYPVEFVLARIGQQDAEFDGDIIPTMSLRYGVFAHSLKCVRCGCVGEFFAKERNARLNKNVGTAGTWRAMSYSWHLNLYAVVHGREILMTKDHVLPKSKGGQDVLPNLQTMCAPCNCSKGNDIVPVFSKIFEKYRRDA